MSATNNLFIVVAIYPDGREVQADPWKGRDLDARESRYGTNAAYATNKATAISAADSMISDEKYRAIGVKMLGRSNTPRYMLDQWQYLVDRSTGVVVKPKKACDKTPLLPMSGLKMPMKEGRNGPR